MDKLIINGGEKLSGEVFVSGSKNAVLPIMAATLIVPGTYKINNVPFLRDTQTMIKLLEIIGAKVKYSNNVLIQNVLITNNIVNGNSNGDSQCCGSGSVVRVEW